MTALPPTALRRSTLLAVATLVVAPAGAQPPFWPAAPEASVAWIDDPATAVAEARRTGRPIVAYVTSDHCGYCRKMERDTWSEPTVARLVAEGFVPLRLDPKRTPDEVAALRVRAFPTTVLLTRDGVGVAGRAGYLSPEELTGLLGAPATPSAVASR